MGVKIENAIRIITNKSISNIEADKQELNGEKFRCPFCNVSLSFRRAGKRKLSKKVVYVSPYFYLEKGKDHGENCDYNTFGKIEIIAKKSLTLNEFMEKKKENQYAIRLQVVKEALKESPEEEEELITTNSDGKAPNKNYKNSGMMAPYLSRMKDIMVLRSKMEENADIKKYLKLEYKSKKINWDKFYFGPDYKEFIELSRYFRNKPEPKHPICIEGMVKEYETKKTKNNKKGYHSFILEKVYVTEQDTVGFKHVPSVRLNINDEHEKLIEYMINNYKKHNKQVIAYGNPYVSVNDSTHHTNVKYHNITIWINRTAQIHLFNDVYDELIEG